MKQGVLTSARVRLLVSEGECIESEERRAGDAQAYVAVHLFLSSAFE